MQEIEYKNIGKITEFFTEKTDEAVKNKMDSRLSELNRQHGEPVTVRRVKIGRNDTCPCGSGVKFKKCCLHKAR